MRAVLLPEQPIRTIFVHVHLMKNAGTTIGHVLQREFGAAFYDVHRSAAQGVIRAETLADFIAQTPDLRALSSHHLRYPLPIAPDLLVVDCCPLRAPIDRLASLYRFFRLHPGASAPDRYAASDDLRTFLRRLTRDFPNYCTNVQTTIVGARGQYRIIGEDDLREAAARIRASYLVCVTHRFDESMAVAEYSLAPLFPGLQLTYRPQNVTRDATLAAPSADALRAEIGADLYAELERLNGFDTQLVAAAEAELDRRIALIPDFAERLRTFRSRCAAPAQ